MTLQWPHMLQQLISESRYVHCLRVAEEAAALALHYGLNGEKARLAGLLHDVARDLPDQELIMLAARYNIPVGGDEQNNPIILHAPVGAAILRQEWRIEDEDILRAVSLHTVAAPGMDDFSKVLYLADLIEPGRKKWPEQDHLRHLCYERLDKAMVEALAGTFRYLQDRGLFIHPRAIEAYEFFKQQESG